MTINATVIDQATEQLAGYLVDILTDDRHVNKAAAMTGLFRDYSDYLKSSLTPENDTPQTLTSKLSEMVAASGLPLEYLLHTARGRNLANHLNELTKKEDKPMTRRSDEMIEMRKFASTPGGMTSIAKHIISKGDTSLTEMEYIDLWKAEAAVHKGEKESDEAAFAKEFAGPRTVKHDAYDIIHNANHLQALKAVAPGGYPGTMSVQVVSVETGNTSVIDDSYKAAAQLKALAAEQKARAPWMTSEQVWDAVYRDPANRSVTARAHPTASSPSYDAEMRG